MYGYTRWAEQINLVSNKVKKIFYLFRELSNILGKRKPPYCSVYKSIKA